MGKFPLDSPVHIRLLPGAMLWIYILRVFFRGIFQKMRKNLKKGIDFIRRVRYNVLLHKRLSRPKIVEQEV